LARFKSWDYLQNLECELGQITFRGTVRLTMKPLLDAMPVVGGLEAYFMKVRSCLNSLKKPGHAKGQKNDAKKPFFKEKYIHRSRSNVQYKLNEEGAEENNPNQYIYLRSVKRLLFHSML
jgi:hypothetical protein